MTMDAGMGFERYDLIVDHYPAMWPLLVPGYVPICNAMLDVVQAMPTRPAEILDLGCGPGTATIAVAPASHPEGMVTLVDGSKRMLDEAKRLLETHVRCTFQGDFTNPSILKSACPPHTYDLILCSFALHHCSDEEKRTVIEEMGHALKPGGVLLLADEIAVDRPGGWDVVERIRGRIIESHLQSGRISPEFWQIETTRSTQHALPFRPSRIDDLTSWMARAGLATSCPVSIFGSALLIGLRPP